MNKLPKLLLSAVTAASLVLPMAASACGGYSHGDMSSMSGGIFETPVRAKGRYVYVTRISRRILKQAVTLHQQPLRARGLRLEV